MAFILDPAKVADLDAFIAGLTMDKTSALIPVLHHAQEVFGYLPQEVQFIIAEKLDLPTAKIYGVASFYSFFTTTPRGKHIINVCLGTACFVGGAELVLNEFERLLEIKNGETTSDNLFTLGQVRCVGACSLAPVVMIDDRVFARVTPEMVPDILTEYRAKEVANDE